MNLDKARLNRDEFQARALFDVWFRDFCQARGSAASRACMISVSSVTEGGLGSNKSSRTISTANQVRDSVAQRLDHDQQPSCPIAFAPQYKPLTRYLPPSELQRLLAKLTEDRAAAVAFIVATSAEWRAVERARREDIELKQRHVLVRGTKRTTRWRTVPRVATSNAR